MIVRESVKIGDKTVTLETGRIAKQAGGAIFITCGETVLLVTVCGAKEPRPGTSFLPLTVDYVEKTYAAGKIPGGFFKREGKLRDSEVLVSRLIDRPCRPLFPEAYYKDIQVVATVMSHDRENHSDVLALTAASAAIHISPVPWAGPVAGVRVGRIDGKYVANPTRSELEKSDCDFIIAASKDAIVMVEGEADEMAEADMVDALMFGHQAVQDTLKLIERLREAVGAPKWAHEPPARPAGIDSKLESLFLAKAKEACNIVEKHKRYGTFGDLEKEAVTTLTAEYPENVGDIKNAFEDLRYKTMRAQVLDEGRRVDGRDVRTVRPISIEVGILPRVHGTALFTRGETQAIVTTTLGTRQDEQKIDGILEEYWKPFMLHYNFPPFSVGETKPMRGPGRREIGHGNLAERALAKVLPKHEQFPYTMRIVSEITESNGSSSMASVCGGSLAMMDAGVPLRAPVAGVAMGLIKEGPKYAVLTDILGDEDHLGDMDFKVCGTQKGITAIQMDIKIAGLSREILTQALAQARDGRLHILEKMNEVLATNRAELSKWAPRITTLKVKPDQIRVIIGPGGKMIKAITEQTGVKIDVEDDGTVSIASSDSEAVAKAIAIISSLTTEPEVGQKYKGIVRRIERYGAFLEIAPGKDGLLHITDMAYEFVEDVESLMKLGDEVDVVVSNIDREGRIRLSRKPLLEKPEGWVEPEERPRGDRDRGRGGDRGRDRDRGRGGDRDRGGRGGYDRGPRPEGDRGPRPEGDRGPRPEGDRGPRPEGDRGPRPEGEGGDTEARGRRRRRRRPEGAGAGTGGGGDEGGSSE